MIKLAPQLRPTTLASTWTMTRTEVPPSSLAEVASQGEKMTSVIHRVVRTTWAINETTILTMTITQRR